MVPAKVMNVRADRRTGRDGRRERVQIEPEVRDHLRKLSQLCGWEGGWVGAGCKRMNVRVDRGRWWALWVVFELDAPVGMVDESEFDWSQKVEVISESCPSSVVGR